MRRLLLIPLLLILSSCSMLKGLMSLNVAPFDGSEYTMATHLRATIAEDSAKCSDPASMKTASVDINNQAFELYLYSSGLPGNDDTSNMERLLQQMTGELQKRYASANSVSSFYCDDKMAILLRSAGTIQKAIGGKPK